MNDFRLPGGGEALPSRSVAAGFNGSQFGYTHSLNSFAHSVLR
jgi:hypothetical protein